MMASIDRDFYDKSLNTIENRTVKALAELSRYYGELHKNELSLKEGQFRRHVFGSRTFFSFRAVISSITGIHKYDRIEVPWWVGLTAFRPHLLNKLLKLGIDHNQAVGLLLGHIHSYHELLDQLLQELIDESPDKGIPVAMNRNPSLLQGSIQKVRISKFKTNPLDLTVGVPITIVVSPNADFK
jgi:DNA-directed RNA polymerase beta' subunit